MTSPEPHAETPLDPVPLGRLPVLGSLLALLIAAGHFASFEVHVRPLLTDVRYFLYFSWRVTEGDAPHLDLFDPKTQLATLVGALLFKLGGLLSVDPLVTIRVGYLGFATLGAWLAHLVHRRLGGSSVAGLLGALAVCAFPLLGDMPAYGNVPKLLMTVAAPLAALCAWRGRWMWAGVAGALAFLDWQIGAVVWVGVFVGAALLGKPRGKACLGVVLGGVLGLLPFLAYFASKGALGAAVDQTIVSAFFRGSTTAEEWSLGEQLSKVMTTCAAGAGGRAWLFWASLGGLPLSLVLLRRTWKASEARLLLPLLVYHFGVLAFSLVDFQSKGDAFVVLHSLAFFQALLWSELLRGARRLPLASGRAALAVPAVLLLVGLAATRPRPLPGGQDADWKGMRLADQVEVAHELERAVGDRTLAAVEKSELLLLLRRENALPFIYWNAASWGHYREGDDESASDALRRILNASEIDALIVQGTKRIRDFGLRFLGSEWTKIRLDSKSGKYFVTVYVR